MFGHSWRIGRIFGVEVRIDPSWLLIALLIASSLFLQFSDSYRTLSALGAVVLAIGATVLFFGSVLAHELTHSLLARGMGIPVRGITLFIFGGATNADVDTKGPKEEFLVSLAGPVSSAALAGAFWGISVLGRAGLPHPVEGALGYLGWVNLLLAGFNLLPGFPLDGGRVLRSVVWGATHSLTKATRVATNFGIAIGYLLIASGVALLLLGGLIGGIWFAAIGWFLAQSAKASKLDMEIRRMIADARLDDVMRDVPVLISPEIPLRDAVDRFMLPSDEPGFPVGNGTEAIGLLTLDAVRAVPRGDWTTVRVSEAMRPLDEGSAVTVETPVPEVLRRMRSANTGVLLVTEGGRTIGVVSRGDIGQWVQRHHELQG